MSMTSELVGELRRYKIILETSRTDSKRIACAAKLFGQAADTIEELSLKLHNSQMERSSMYYNGWWIPVEERLPEINHYGLYSDDVLVVVQDKDNKTYAAIGIYSSCGWGYELDGDYKDYVALKWMPIPPL